MKESDLNTNDTRKSQAQRITWIGFFVNLLLSTGKLLAGIIGRSAAMIADGVHSISDFITDFVVIGFIRVADKESDEDHRYGHGKFETFATLLVSLVLLLVGAGILWNGGSRIIDAIAGKELGQPSMVALIAAVVSILAKEILFQYTLRVGKSINSQAVIANAWHHRSDALSSIGTLLGIAGAIFLGEKWRILDPLAGMIVSVFIIRVAIRLGFPSVKELLETALPADVEDEIVRIINDTPGVKGSHHLKTRQIGNDYAIDVHVEMDGELSLIASHDIATLVEERLYEKYGRRTQISIHTEPHQER
ncbi:MAG: cation diffusion facilitator family transporter [Bacteroidales bacterium]|nr:cation diffusion facilitator family transporter [Bacteroidales bacterium]MDD3811458.1 cation diffusion facilitator family transporter [Bacteroidales bacterium]